MALSTLDQFSAHGTDGEPVRERTFYSVGGGFVVDGDVTGADRIVQDTTEVPCPFTGGQLLEHCRREDRSIAGIMLANERSWRSQEQLRSALLHIWSVMQECVENGCTRTEERPASSRPCCTTTTGSSRERTRTAWWSSC